MDVDRRIVFIDRARRLLRFKELNAPEVIIEEERKLIKRSLAELTPDDVAHCMASYKEVIEKLTKLEAEVEAENPVYPDD